MEVYLCYCRLCVRGSVFSIKTPELDVTILDEKYNKNNLYLGEEALESCMGWGALYLPFVL